MYRKDSPVCDGFYADRPESNQLYIKVLNISTDSDENLILKLSHFQIIKLIHFQIDPFPEVSGVEPSN
jgi:hypothetical protein